jgi:hypothetical protein
MHRRASSLGPVDGVMQEDSSVHMLLPRDCEAGAS